MGLRIGLAGDKVVADLTVMPLIAGTEYRQLLSITQGAKIAPGAGDPHPALAQFTLAINPKSPLVQQANGMARAFAPNLNVDPLSWLGSAVSFYLDDDAFWAEAAAAKPEERSPFMEKNWPRMPLGLQFEVSSSLKLTAFLVAARAFIDQTSGNMLKWESLDYRGRVRQGLAGRTPGTEPGVW